VTKEHLRIHDACGAFWRRLGRWPAVLTANERERERDSLHILAVLTVSIWAIKTQKCWPWLQRTRSQMSAICRSTAGSWFSHLSPPCASLGCTISRYSATEKLQHKTTDYQRWCSLAPRRVPKKTYTHLSTFNFLYLVLASLLLILQNFTLMHIPITLRSIS